MASMEAADEVGEDQYWIYTGEDEVPVDVTHVRVPDGVTGLRERAFGYRERLVAVELNEELVEIGRSAFYSCTSLECVRIPSSVTTVGEYAFLQCSKLSHVEFPEGSRVGAIGKGAFDGCKSLTEIILPRSLSALGEHTFARCYRLTRVDLANTTLTTIEDCTFQDCRSLDDVHLPVTIKTVGVAAFRDCTSLSTIVLHEGTETIDNWAFSGCINLSIHMLPSTVETIAASAFSGCSLRHFTSPLHCKGLKLSALGCCEKLKSIQIVGDNTMLVNDCNNYCVVRLPSLLRMNIPRSYYDIHGMFRQGNFLSNICIAPDSSIHEGAYEDMIHKFNKKGCTLDMIRSRFKQLPLHEICFDYSNQHTEVTFEQVKDCLKKNADAVREKDCIGMTPLHIIACSTNHDVRLFQILISSSHKTLMDLDIFGRTALDYALLSDAPEEVFYLMFEPFVRMRELPLNLELIYTAVEHNVPALQTWEVFADYIEMFFPLLDLDWEGLFLSKVCYISEMPSDTYRWFAKKAVKQRMIKKNTLTLTRQSKINEMIDSFQYLPLCLGGGLTRQARPVWKLMKMWELKEATILLELSLWKCRLNDASVGSGSRVAARVGCGADIIIREVVQYLSHGDSDKEIFGQL
ncbi:hypothetical protein THAOC_24548 [Thalassiosira oceanica]|uniref:Uncharacterized protein n=1 Tax=Thalassiosira oceanica TaxID=159749 RepID=K0S469_THAOC|nr:hypothetical protein THAOC_24548 [Thalassiosira oceanica]|eukprot:EJK55691.1 hypothetical protein THAOC_24548 [Thalassiosira oceanica]